MQNKIRWSVRIIITAILLFSILFEVAETISEKDFNEIIERPSVMGLFIIFALISYVTSWFNTKLAAILLLIFSLVLAIFTFAVPSGSVRFKAIMIPLIGIFILIPVVYWALKRKKQSRF
jgi:hypothetical protein